VENSIKCLSQGHSDVLSHWQSNQGFATFRLLDCHAAASYDNNELRQAFLHEVLNRVDEPFHLSNMLVSKRNIVFGM